MASELRDMDEDVSSLSRTLAVRTLQLEMEYIFSCIEDEALDIAQDLKGAGYLLLRYINSWSDTCYLHGYLPHHLTTISPARCQKSVVFGKVRVHRLGCRHLQCAWLCISLYCNLDSKVVTLACLCMQAGLQ